MDTDHMNNLLPRVSTLHYLAATFVLATAAAGPAAASVVTFAQTTQANGALQAWSISTSTTGGVTTTSIHESASGYLTFSGVSGLPFAGPESANFVLNASSTQAGNCGMICGAGDSYSEFGFTGTFSILDTGSAPGTNLLSGSFQVTGSPSTTGAQFSSNIGSGSGSFQASTTAGNLNQLIMTSAYLNFAGQTQETAQWGLSSVSPDFALGTVSAGSGFPAAGPFTASGVGTFSSNPGPTGAPEPASMALIGSGLIGLGLLRRKKLAPVTSNRTV
jgi:hypothetical protein